MNRTSLIAQGTTLSTTDETTAQLWLIRAGKEQKAFVAMALELIERLDAWRDHCVDAEAVAQVEAEAQRLGFPEVCTAMRAVGRLLLAYNARTYQHAGAATIAPLPAKASRPLSALLLRVYLTGTDAGGEVEREQVQELVALHMQQVLPSSAHMKSVHN